MKSIKISLLLLTVGSALIAVAGFASEPPAASLPPEIQVLLNRYRADHIKSMMEGRPEIVSPYYADQIRLMPEFQKTILGKLNAIAYDRAFASRFAIGAYERKTFDVLSLGTRWVEVGTFHLVFALKRDGTSRELTGKYLEIWQKPEGGTPALETSAWNHDRPIEFADDLRFPELPAMRMALQTRVPVRDPLSLQLAAFNRLLESAIIQHDGDLWSQFYAPDAVMLANYSRMLIGKNAVDAYIKEHTAQLPIFEKLDLRNDRIDEAGRYVIEYASHVANWRNGDSSGVSTGKNIRIWRRDADGFLRIIRQIGMYD